MTRIPANRANDKPAKPYPGFPFFRMLAGRRFVGSRSHARQSVEIGGMATLWRAQLRRDTYDSPAQNT